MKNYNIPIFVPHEGCPFNCSFCNQKKITGADTSITDDKIREIIEEHLKTLPKTDRHIEAAFFGGSFTGISMEKQREFLSVAYEYVKSGEIDGIRLSTRPDYISEEILNQLAEFGVTAIELGVQSMDSDVLNASYRGHTQDDVYSAVRLIREYDFKLGLQMMTGLPSDTDEKAIETAEKIITLKPDCVRIYPTLVLKDTLLETMYLNGEYVPQKLDDAVDLCKKLLILFEKSSIPVIRMALVTTDEISPNGAVVAGPFHSSFRELAEGEIFFDEICNALNKDAGLNTVCVNPADISKAIGHCKRNISRIRTEYGINLKIKQDEKVERGKIKFRKE